MPVLSVLFVSLERIVKLQNQSCELWDFTWFFSFRFIYICLVVFQCLVLLQVTKCFVPVQIFWASPKILSHLVPLQKLLRQHKNEFYWMQIIFWSSTKCLWLAQYVNQFLVRYKKFGPAQNILGPVKGQGIRKTKVYKISFNRFQWKASFWNATSDKLDV